MAKELQFIGEQPWRLFYWTREPSSLRSAAGIAGRGADFSPSSASEFLCQWSAFCRDAVLELDFLVLQDRPQLLPFVIIRERPNF